jgi:two-component system CheB/CheR fusion protein
VNDASRFPIVGIGASAGGVEALEGFFRGVPETPGLAFVVVTHLGPHRQSLLHEIVTRYTQLPVRLIADDMLVEKDCIYVLPSDVLLSIDAGRLKTREQESTHRERKPIDLFFCSLANDQGELGAGVILSGGDSDGTLGVKAIKGRGGLTLAQVGSNGSGPQHTDMPESAISAGMIDLAIPVEQMGGKLAEFARSPYVLDDIAFSASEDDNSEQIAAARRAIYAILRSQVGHDFSGYKTKTFVRRIRRRMQVRQIETLDAYVESLRKDAQEVNALFRDLLINVTSFFRDAEAFEQLGKTVIPQLFEKRGPDDIVRIWVPGCATGEEVYSLGIMLLEYTAQLTAAPKVQIFATDIDERALSVARAGRYPEPLLDGVSAQRRERFFVPDAGSFLVSKAVRDLCIFSPHSVIRDPPFSRIDLVSCRNLLIYFGMDIQGQVIPTFHYALRPEGVLFLGTSESVSQFDDLFTPIEKKHRIFRRRSDVAPHVRLPLMVSSLRPGHGVDLTPRRPILGAAALRQTLDTQVLDRFAPPHVLVNRDGDVAYFSSRTGRYLEPAAGVPTRQIFTMARKGLRLDLRTVFREVVETGRTVTRDNIAIDDEEGRVQLITLTVEPLENASGSEPMYLILFADQGPLLSREDAALRSQAPHESALQIERELRETRERLQSIIEEYETALEELKSSNEELVSVNEELQSTNEELEASKEELVSLNEELHTVNTELSGKIEALDRANSDLQNLFDSTAVSRRP